MRKTALLIFVCLFLLLGVKEIEAKTPSPTVIPTVVIEATPVVERENITEVSNKIEKVTPEVRWQGWNMVSFFISKAVLMGVPENTVVLLLLLPLVATIVSLLHYVVGVSGYGIFTPTMMAVALLATGVVGGVALFVVILAITLLSNLILRKYKLHFWPARSITLLFVSLGTFGLMSGAAVLGVFEVSKISIFPILFMILLTEEFVRTQLIKSKKEAVRLTIGTLILAGVGALTMGVGDVQNLVLKYPEAVILLVIVVNLLVGSYGGIRLTEIKRFKNAIRKK
ncbi:MAG TPA: 7TM domain-containing protein [Candidatus Methanoperedens sp.]|nr:7TM domain-containing protein [Candidatus Methanoperedens sp.]